MKPRAAPTAHQHRVGIVISADEQRAEVTIQGHTQLVTGRDPKELRRNALTVATSYATRAAQPVLIDARDAQREWQLMATPEGVVRTVLESEPPSPPRARRGGKGKAAAITVACVLAVATVVGAGAVALRLWPETATAADGSSPAGQQVAFDTRPPPLGFSDQAEWRVPMASETLPVVSPDGGAVAYINPDERLRVLGPGGAQQWVSDLPVGLDDIDGPLRYVRAGDSYRVALIGDGALWLWPAKGGEPDRVDLPEGAETSFAGSAPLVHDGGKTFVLSGGELARVEPPDGTGALLAAGGKALAASAQGPWAWVGAGGEPSEVKPEKPEGAQGLEQVLTASADHVILRWSTSEGGKAVLGVHDSKDGTVVAAAKTSPSALEDAQWVSGTSAAAYGPVLLDLEQGTAQIVPGFTPVSTAGGTVYGEIDGAAVAVGQDGNPNELSEGTARPWGLLDGRAIVVANGDLYALPPE